MKVLIAEDDTVTRLLVARHLVRWGYVVVEAASGEAAWEAMTGPEPPPLAIIDWMLPGLDGVEICRRIRASAPAEELSFYLVILTGRDRPGDLVEALDAGADDFLTKPFDPDELHARIRTGERIVTLQRQLQGRVVELAAALERITELQELVPICSYCRQVRDDKRFWQTLESYMARRKEVRFSHGICPDCYDEHFRDALGKMDIDGETAP